MRLDAGWQKTLAELMEKRLDIDLLLEKTRYSMQTGPRPLTSDLTTGLPGAAEGWAGGGVPKPAAGASPPEIAVARDAAFCFYYPDNLELLEKAGARLRFFSPVCGDTLPEACSGAYLGGGYPELFAKAISENARFLHSLRERAGLRMPIYAECGGLMTLGRFIDTIEGEKYNMAGILPFGTRMLPRRKALGYTEVVLRRQCLLGGPGRVIRGHEFHYSEIVEQEPEAGRDEVHYSEDSNLSSLMTCAGVNTKPPVPRAIRQVLCLPAISTCTGVAPPRLPSNSSATAPSGERGGKPI